jgi:hypothetical protein
VSFVVRSPSATMTSTLLFATATASVAAVNSSQDSCFSSIRSTSLSSGRRRRRRTRTPNASTTNSDWRARSISDLERRRPRVRLLLSRRRLQLPRQPRGPADGHPRPRRREHPRRG